MSRKLWIGFFSLLLTFIFIVSVIVVTGSWYAPRTYRVPSFSSQTLTQANQHQQTKTITQSLDYLGQLRVENQIGTITMLGSDRPDIALTATLHARSSSMDQAKSLLDQMDIMTTTDDDLLFITAQLPTTNNTDQVSVDFHLLVPENLVAEITTHIGKLDIQAISGDLTLTNRLGQIDARRLSGNAIIVANLGAINLRDSHFADILKVTAGLGDVLIQGSLAKQTSISSTMGSLTLRLPHEGLYSLRAAVSLGQFSSKLPFHGESTRTSFHGRLGQGAEVGALDITMKLGSVSIIYH